MKYHQALLRTTGVLGLLLLAREPARADATDSDRVKANSYDDGWQDAWVAHGKSIHTSATGKTEGFVIYIGDSITYGNQNSNFAYDGGKNADDKATIKWSLGGGNFSDNGPTNKNGWHLARFDHPEGGRSYTASSGISAAEWLTGDYHGMAAGIGDKTPLDTLLKNTSTKPYKDPNFYVAVVRDAQIVVMQLGTNDIGHGDSVATIKANLTSMIQKFEAAKMIVVMMTIPPRRDTPGTVAVNTMITALAHAQSLPLVDYYAESLRRRSGTSWDGTLISGDGVHPTGPPYQDPDANGGQALSDSGYLLRSWLIVQKLTEVRKAVLLSSSSSPDAGAGKDAAAMDSGAAKKDASAKDVSGKDATASADAKVARKDAGAGGGSGGDDGTDGTGGDTGSDNGGNAGSSDSTSGGSGCRMGMGGEAPLGFWSVVVVVLFLARRVRSRKA